MKKIVLFIALISTMLFAKTELKDGNYSWIDGGSQAYLTVKKVKGHLYHLTGDCLYGVGRKNGPNMGQLDFEAPLKDGKLIYKDKEHAYKFVLTMQKDGSFKVDEIGTMFGLNASFYGHFTSDDLPSFSCDKASTFVEKAICNNVKIARLDREMARLFERYRSAFFFDDKREKLNKALMKEQKKWMKKRDKCEFSKVYKICLMHSYENRIKRIEKEFNSFWKYD